MNIGIPQGLSYFEYYPMWQTFLTELGHNTILSGLTTKDILNKGVSSCVDDACLPVKVFHGHIVHLIDKADLIFIPRLVMMAPGEFICPKFIGLPEMIKNSIEDLPPIIILDYDLRKGFRGEKMAFYELGSQLGASLKDVNRAYKEARIRQDFYEDIQVAGENPYDLLYNNERQDYFIPSKGTIGLIGHPYLLYDKYLSMDIIKKLRDRHYNFVVPANEAQDGIDFVLKDMPKRLFWSYGKKLLGSGMKWLRDKKVHGIIYLSSFGCGIDSFIEDLLNRYNLKENPIPYTVFTLDEHSGQSGFDTRLEAFLDMLEWRKSYGNNISAHGMDVYTR